MTIPATQTDAAALLQRLAERPPIETHISAVFVGADTVWKLKKAVRLPFLDFSTLEARRSFLHRELALNAPAAPAIYRDVVPIGRLADGSLALGDGEPVDWVLRMAPVPEADFLDAIATAGHLDATLLDRLGDCVARDHARLPPVQPWNSADRMVQVIQGNTASALAAGLPSDQVTLWRDICLSLTARLGPWLQARVQAGFVRRCHGDLHLGNFCLWQGEPVAFDALEFDEAMATIDTGYDLAFLLMDLEQRLGRGAANRVMNRYVARTGDAGMVTGLPLFLSLRAMIRAHVRGAQGMDATALLAAAQDYLRPDTPRILAIGGLQGTGKSTLARHLAPSLGRAPGALVVRSDEIRKRLFGRAPEEKLGAEAYRAEVSERVNAALIEAACSAAAGGQAVIVDSTFLHPAMADQLAEGLRPIGLQYSGIWLDAPLTVLEQRVVGRHGDASDATVAVLRQSAAHVAAAKQGPPAGWTVVDATDLDQAAHRVRVLIAMTPSPATTA